MFIIVLFSCKKNKNPIINNSLISQHIISFQNDKLISENVVNVCDIIDTMMVVKLETKKECLIGNPRKIKVISNRIFILDTNSGLFEFNFDGDFVKKIGEIGKGPGEYISPKAFDVDEKRNEIYVYDRSTLKILKYDFQGNFKEGIKVNVYAYDFIVDKKNEGFIFDTHLEKQKGWSQSDVKQFSITRTDVKGNLTLAFLETNKKENSLNYKSRYNLFSNDSIILFNKPFKNKIYQIKQSEVVPLFSFEFGKTIPDGFSHDIQVRDFMEKIEENGYDYFNNNSGYFIANKKLLFSVQRQGGREEYIYNILTKELSQVNTKTDASSCLAFLGLKVCSYKNMIVSYAQTEWFFNNKSLSSGKYNGTRIGEIMKHTKEGDNPIIIFNILK